MSWRVVASKIRYEQHRPVAVAHQGPIHEDRLPRALRETTRVPINGAGDRMFQIIQTDFKKIGVQLTMRKMDTDAATTAINGSDNKYTGYDLAMWDWVPR